MWHVMELNVLKNRAEARVTLNNGTACSGCSPIHTRSTPIPKEDKITTSVTSLHTMNLPVVHMFTLTVVNHALLGENHEQTVDLEHSDPGCDDHWHLAGAVKVTVDIVLVKHCGRHSDLQLVSLFRLGCIFVTQGLQYIPLKERLMASR